MHIPMKNLFLISCKDNETHSIAQSFLKVVQEGCQRNQLYSMDTTGRTVVNAGIGGKENSNTRCCRVLLQPLFICTSCIVIKKLPCRLGYIYQK